MLFIFSVLRSSCVAVESVFLRPETGKCISDGYFVVENYLKRQRRLLQTHHNKLSVLRAGVHFDKKLVVLARVEVFERKKCYYINK